MKPIWAVRMLAALLFITSVGEAAEITVRVLSAKDGHQLAEKRIGIFVMAPPGMNPPPGVIFKGEAPTDGSGIVTFVIEAPLQTGARIYVDGLVDYCSPPSYEADRVLGTGVAEQLPKSCPHRALKKFAVKPHPGEIVMFSGEYSRWERMLYFPWPS